MEAQGHIWKTLRARVDESELEVLLYDPKDYTGLCMSPAPESSVFENAKVAA
jgi:hypothetical protein